MRMGEFVDEWYVLRTTQNGEFVGNARPAHFVRSSSRCCAIGAVCARGAQFSFCRSSSLW